MAEEGGFLSDGPRRREPPSPHFLLPQNPKTKMDLGFREFFLPHRSVPVVRRLLLPDGGPRKPRRRRRQGWRDGDAGSSSLASSSAVGERRDKTKPSPQITPESASYGHFGKEITKMPLPPCLETECPQGHSGLLAVKFLIFLLLKISSGR